MDVDEPMETVKDEELSGEDVDTESDCEESEEELMEQDDEDQEDGQESKEEVKQVTFLPGQKLEKDQELVADMSAYRMLHQCQTGAPCLSFDIIRDDLGDNREDFPMSMYMCAGTQAARAHVNNLLIVKMSNMQGSKPKNEDSDEESSDEEDEEENPPAMKSTSIKHHGCVNRVRCTQVGSTALAASWSELGRVNIWNLNDQLRALENEHTFKAYQKAHDKGENISPIYTFKGHLSEGYGVDWSPLEAGTLATGDCKGNIHIWRLNNNASGMEWNVDQRPYNSHAPHSVEDLQWSPTEKNVLASCSVDRSIKIWDIRVSPKSACMLTAAEAHTADVNVISWNKLESKFMISGGDDGVICVWDLRYFKPEKTDPIAKYKQHTSAVTTVEWSPHEGTVFASGGADDQITQWDLSVEADEEAGKDEDWAKLPPQLLFIHQGQTEIKELHWHPQCPGVVVSTAHSGFNVFRTISV